MAWLRALLRWLGRLLRRWSDFLLAAEPGVALTSPETIVVEEPSRAAAPPAHWVDLVRVRAPHFFEQLSKKPAGENGSTTVPPVRTERSVEERIVVRSKPPAPVSAPARGPVQIVTEIVEVDSSAPASAEVPAVSRRIPIPATVEEPLKPRAIAPEPTRVVKALHPFVETVLSSRTEVLLNEVNSHSPAIPAPIEAMQQEEVWPTLPSTPPPLPPESSERDPSRRWRLKREQARAIWNA